MNTETFTKIRSLIDAEITALTEQWSVEKRTLQRQIEELKNYSNVSMVRSMANEISNLATENGILKKKLGIAKDSKDKEETKPTYREAKQRERVEKEKKEKEEKETQQSEEHAQEEQTQEPEEQTHHQEDQTQQPEEQTHQTQQPEEQTHQTQEPEEQTHQTQEPEEQTHHQEDQTQQPEEQTHHQEDQTQQPEEQTHQEDQTQQPEEQTHQEDQTQEPEEQTQQQEELVALELSSGNYFWDRETGELYEMLSETECGECTNKLKSVSIKGNLYYIDGNDSSIYVCEPETCDVGARVGHIKDKRAVFN